MYRSPSQILRQFQPSLDELTQHGYLAKWRMGQDDESRIRSFSFMGRSFIVIAAVVLSKKTTRNHVIVVGESEAVEPNLPEPAGSVVNSPVAKADVSDNHPGSNRDGLADVQGKLVDDLSARGLMPSAVLKLLGTFPSGRLETVPDYMTTSTRRRRVAMLALGCYTTSSRTAIPCRFRPGAKRQSVLQPKTVRGISPARWKRSRPI